MNNHRFFLKTYGCQMNERDSEALSCLLEEHGYVQTESEEDARIIILNTCSVREAAENKAIGKTGILGRLKRRKPELIIIVVGCMAQNLGAELIRKIPHLDAVVGPDCLPRLPAVIDAVSAGRGPRIELAAGPETTATMHRHRTPRISAFVAVMRGCNQHCSYCIVPQVRGREKSRPMAGIVQEVEELGADGCREVLLLGQNITAYGLAEARTKNRYSPEISPFADLLRNLNPITGIERIRFTSPHPQFMNDKFITTVIELDKVCESFHLPVQSGSDRILQTMGRGYTVDEYRRITARLKAGLPNVTFSTDVIVGFPGETEDDFQATRDLLEEIGFDMAYIFKYSPRKKTRAAQWADNVPTAVKERRNQILLDDLAKRTARHNRSCLGRRVEVLLEGPSKRNPDRWSGRTRENKVCLIDATPDLRPGMILTAEVTDASSSSLFGTVRQSRVPL